MYNVYIHKNQMKKEKEDNIKKPVYMRWEEVCLW